MQGKKTCKTDSRNTEKSVKLFYVLFSRLPKGKRYFKKQSMRVSSIALLLLSIILEINTTSSQQMMGRTT